MLIITFLADKNFLLPHNISFQHYKNCQTPNLHTQEYIDMATTVKTTSSNTGNLNKYPLSKYTTYPPLNPTSGSTTIKPSSLLNLSYTSNTPDALKSTHTTFLKLNTSLSNNFIPLFSDLKHTFPHPLAKPVTHTTPPSNP